MGSVKKITYGEVDILSKDRNEVAHMWSIDEQAPLYIGAFGLAPGLDESNPLTITLLSNQYIGGFCSTPQRSIDDLDDVYAIRNTSNTSRIESNIIDGLDKGSFISQSALLFTDSTIEWNLTGLGSANIGDKDDSYGSIRVGELSNYTRRYRLTSGSDLDEQINVSLSIENLSSLFEQSVSPLNVTFGDEKGISLPSRRHALEEILVYGSIGLGESIYAYIKDDKIPLPSDEEVNNIAYSGCKLLIRSDSFDGNTTIIDSSLDSRSLSYGNIEHSIDEKVFGDTSLFFKNKLSTISIDNTDDQLFFINDFTIRMLFKMVNLGNNTTYRLFTFGDDYIDLIGPNKITGHICNVIVDAGGIGDFNDWTEFCLLRDQSFNIYISINGKCVFFANSIHSFGQPWNFSNNISNTRVAQIAYGPYNYNNSVTDNNGTTYYRSLNGSSMTMGVGLEMPGDQVIGQYSLYCNSTPPTRWVLQGSNNNANWTTLDERTGQSLSNNTWYYFDIPLVDNPAYDDMYRYYRLFNIETYRYIAEFGLYEVIRTADTARTFILGNNNVGNNHMIGYLEDIQLNNTYLEDQFGRINNGANYIHPGLKQIKALDAQFSNRLGLKLTNTRFNVLDTLDTQVSASAEIAGFEASQLIDNDVNTFWDSGQPTASIQFSDNANLLFTVNGYILTIQSGRLTDAPVSWNLEGFDGSIWINLDNRTDVDDWTDGESKYFDFIIARNIAYESYRISILTLNGGSASCLNAVALSYDGAFVLDNNFTPFTKIGSASASSVKSGELHLSANDSWTTLSDAESLGSIGTFIDLPLHANGQILIDNTSRPASANTLIRVNNISWGNAYTLYNDSLEVPYRFVSSDYSTSTTVDSTIMFRLDLPADTLVILDTDSSIMTTNFLDEKDIFLDSTDNADTDYFTKLAPYVTDITIDGYNVELLDGDLLNAEVLAFDTKGVYKSWNNIYTMDTAYASQGAGCSAQNNVHMLFCGYWSTSSFGYGADDLHLYSKITNTIIRKDTIYSRLIGFAAIAEINDDFYLLMGMQYANDLKYIHHYVVNTNTLYRKADSSVALDRHSSTTIDNKIYSLAGYKYTGGVPQNIIQIYDIITNVSSVSPSTCATSRYGHGSSPTLDGSILSIGGYGNSVSGQADLTSFDTNTGVEVVLNNNCDCGGIAYYGNTWTNSKVYIAGGRKPIDNTSTNEVWTMDRSTHTFALSNEITVRTGYGQVFGIFDEYYVEGIGSAGKYLYVWPRKQFTWANYDQVNATNKNIDYSGVKSLTATVGDNLNRYVIISGGADLYGGDGYKDTSAYNYRTNNWIKLPDCPISHVGAAGGSYIRQSDDHNIFVVWYENNLYEYDVEDRSWSTAITVTDGTLQTAVKDFAYDIHIIDDVPHLYMYGGRNTDDSVSDQFCYIDLLSYIMYVPTVSGVTVPPLTEAVAQAETYDGRTKNAFMIYGGTQGTLNTPDTITEIFSNQLRFTANGGESLGVLKSIEKFVGNINVTLDLSSITFTNSNSRIALELYDSDRTRISIRATSTNEWLRYLVIDGVTETSITASRTNPNGQIRIERIGTSVSCYYTDGVGGTETLLCTDVFTGSDLSIRIFSWVFTSGETVSVDNLTVNSVIYDDFVGLDGTKPDQTKWILDSQSNPYQFVQENTVYKLDLQTLEWEGSTITTHPTGPVVGTPYIDRNSSDIPHIILRADDNTIWYVRMTDMLVGNLSMSGIPPKYGPYGVFQVDYYADTYEHLLFLIGLGDVNNGEIGLALFNNRIIEVDISFGQLTTPDTLSISYEPLDTYYNKFEVEVSGFDGTNWVHMAHIPHSVNNYSSAAYILHNDTAINTMRLKCVYGKSDAASPFLLTSIQFLANTKFAKAIDYDIDLLKPSTECLCNTLTTDINDQTLPTTNFGAYGAKPTFAQNYVVYDQARTGMYRQLSAAPSGYPYSTKYSTSEDNRIELDLTAVDHIDVLSIGDVRFAFSFDDRVTWNIYLLGAWTSIDIANDSTFRSSGMTKDEVEDIPGSAFTAYIGTGKFVDLAVLNTLNTANEFSYFNTMVFISTDINDRGYRLMTPYNNWVSTLLQNKVSLNFRTYTEILSSTQPYVLNCFDIGHGYHPRNLVTSDRQDISFQEAYTEEDVECAWAYLDKYSRLPEKNGSSYPSNGSMLRGEVDLKFFDYNTETLSNITGSSQDQNQFTYRCGFGNAGRIMMLYSTNGTTGQQEVLESHTGTLYNLSSSGVTVMGGGGCALSNDDYAWLSPGCINTNSFNWYNSLTKVDYSLSQTYSNQRCILPSLATSYQGGVSDKQYGWILHKGAILSEYNIIKLDYANDIAGVTATATINVTGPADTYIDTIGCSSHTLNEGYFLLSHDASLNTTSRKMAKLIYSNDTVPILFRSDSTYIGSVTEYYNCQARSVGPFSICIWTNRSDKIGPLTIDTATDTCARRFRGSGGDNMHGNTYCGSQTEGLSF